MGKSFTSAFVVCLLVSALPLACGDDEDDGGGGGGKGGKGGSAGMTGGTAGSGARGGSGGSGGTTGGSGGRGGTGGSAGRGGAGSGGTIVGGMGGMGGEDGGMGGVPDTGGVGGEGGGGTTPSLCERYCTAGAVANCTNTMEACVTTCEYNFSYTPQAPCPDLMTALYECHIAGGTAGWQCNQNQPVYSGAECMDEAQAAAAAYCLN